MSDILKFACKAPNCGRRFTTQEALNSHFKLRHPKINTNNNNVNDIKSIEEKKEKEKQSMENIIKQISRTKINQHEKHHLLQPIEHKGLSSSTLNNIKRKSQTINTNKDINNLNNNQIVSNNNEKSNKSNDKKEKVKNKNNENIIKKNNKKEEKEIEEVEIPNIIEEKQKRLLNNLFNQINSLDNYLEKDCEFHKEFTLPDVPDYDKMYDSDEDNEDNNKKKEEIKVKPKNIINEMNSENKIYEITYDMIYNNNDFDYGKFKEIKEINLCKKKLMTFKNNVKINFEKLTELNLLNISHNYLSDINDVHFFENLKELYINNNKIEDISFCENLPNLAILNAEYNNIITITSLNICSKLKILKLSHNKIKYLNSTLRTIKNLKNIDELSIKENPFLSELFSYREYFITNYPNIKILDEEKISIDTKIFAEKFYKENNPLYNKNRPLSSRLDIDKSNNINKKINYNLFEDERGDDENDENDEDIFNNNDLLSKTQASFNDNTNKKKEDKKIKKVNNDINQINDSNKDYEKKEEVKEDEETKLRNIINEQNKLINELKKDLEKSSKLNQKYEEEIEKYKHELNEENDINNNLIINDMNNDEEEEIKKIKNELETWKKEYFKLLDKTMNGKNLNDKFSEDSFNNESIPELNKKEINPKIIIERPKTANIEGRMPKNFELLYKEINNLENINNSENEEDIEEENGEEEEEKEKSEEKKEKEKVNINENEGFDDEEEIPDEEIEEMLRKSYQDLKKMKQDIRFMNDTIDKNSKKININNNIVNMHANNIIGNKQILKPIILKKEKNNSLLGNKAFGKQGIGNEKTEIDKSGGVGDKNPSLRYQDILYQLKK